MNFGGFEKLTLTDFPGKIACIVYTIGCNFRCKYCYNPDIITENNFNISGRKIIEEKEILDFIKANGNMVDGVVITGGEPTIYKDLLNFCKKLKKLNKFIKLDTNGACPDNLLNLLDEKLIDYIAMDVKAPLEKYKQITAYDNTENILKSINIIKNSGVPHEFRTTMYPELTPEDIIKITELVQGEKIYLQDFDPTNTLYEEAKNFVPYKKEEINMIIEKSKNKTNIIYRNN